MAAQKETLADQSLLLSMIHGMWQTRCLSVLVGLKIPELLCNTKEQSLSIEEVASKTGCISTNQIYQIMRVLAQWGIGVEMENKHFAKNHAMKLLRRDGGPSMGHVVGYFCSEEMWKATVSFPEAVRQNCPAFVLEHGMDNFKYMNANLNDSCKFDPENMSKCNFSTNRIGSDERRREFLEEYTQAMSMWSHIQIQPDEPGLKNVYKVFPWSTCTILMDIGGCSGHFLASILKQPGCEHIQGYVVDLPQVIDRAKANVHDFGIPQNRIAFIKQDFTKPLHRDVQNLQVDTIVLKNIIGMLDFNSAVNVLKNCRSLLSKEKGRCLIAASCIPEAGDTKHNVGENGIQWGFVQIHVMCHGHGLKKSKSERIEYVTKAGGECGFKLSEVYDTFSGGVTIFELRPI